jgi:ubiquinone/menaquinone biosynthesis C-methylase UbiE
MLRVLRDKKITQEGNSFRIRRSVAERLSWAKDESFDLVIMGFGLPSYTRYYESLAEAYRVCKRGGICLASVYNENSKQV